jgi:uncharacterized metal-binding protein YceD (DUF177 family)
VARQQEHISSEFSRPITLGDIPEGGEVFRLEARPEERVALAKRFDLLDLSSLDAEGKITTFDHGRRARVEGIVRAHVVQSCVITLEPVDADIEERFVRTYMNAPAEADGGEIVVEMSEDDPPDPVVGGQIDVGESVAEILGLALDPYPRAPGAELPGTVAEGAGERNRAKTGRESPFSALKGLLKKP